MGRISYEKSNFMVTKTDMNLELQNFIKILTLRAMEIFDSDE